MTNLLNLMSPRGVRKVNSFLAASSSPAPPHLVRLLERGYLYFLWLHLLLREHHAWANVESGLFRDGRGYA